MTVCKGFVKRFFAAPPQKVAPMRGKKAQSTLHIPSMQQVRWVVGAHRARETVRPSQN
jgi:hypothetical protein